jgi:hypothetical protein
VKRAFAPEFLSWNMSSLVEYAAFAGDTIPESRWTAYDKVIVSTCRRSVRVSEPLVSVHLDRSWRYRIQGKDPDDLVPF